ncbi:hypothetical protein GCK72_023680 [Caenorhabditis remanei]|uniref:Metalloendopeptidase n=1 Tax=Caenorhabditis remanei TaxID=31234 RepID=A0A6A5FX44_CAERE|nr:hypothetical protein GCK72_023680 [Caenorhabditis remanei]KAF1747218.1 hypothetical protein GCK72_023680 [Caenorhabditis remanei]
MGFNGGFNMGQLPPNSPPGSRPGSPFGEIMGNIGGMMKGLTDQIGKITQGLDVNNDLGKMAGGPPPPQNEWMEHARRFCRRFPGHPKCRYNEAEHVWIYSGQLPQFNDIGSMLNGILADTGKWLPKVPFINIRDPLAGINNDLRNALAGISVQFGQISQQIANNIKNICQRVNCKQQLQKNVQMKQDILKSTVAFEKKIFGNDVADKMNMRFDRTLQLKQALLEKAQLKGVVAPEDNGVFDKDLLLTETQANFMLNELGKGGEGAIPLPGSAKAKRASIFFEQNIIQKWPITAPIPYTFDSSLDNLDQNDVRGAISEIEQKTCIRFKYYATPPRGNHINYQKVNSPSFCGLSYIGRVEPANPVYLSFQCGNGRGIAVHETMHALGVNHQHLRMDRDKHIRIDWSNINPQQYDAFVVADSKMYTTYGVKYAYDSIMHYNAYTAAVNIAKPTMIPLVNQQSNIGLLGQRAKMSVADVEILNKMYCKAAGCDDKNVYCGAWALQDLCNNPNHNVWMRSNCRKSCNFC